MSLKTYDDLLVKQKHQYWDEFYQKHRVSLEPSSFARYVMRYLMPSDTLLEFGFGNGRDALFFASEQVNTLGIDYSCQAVAYAEQLSKELNLRNCSFVRNDFTKLNLSSISNHFDHIYSRFTLHAVSKSEASSALYWASKHLRFGGKIYIEVRSVNDELYGVGEEVGKDEFIFGHYRRFIRPEDLSSELERLGLEIVEMIEGKNFSPVKGSNPTLIRVIAKLNSIL